MWPAKSPVTQPSHAGLLHCLGLTERLLTQERTSKNKLYSLHAPEVVCIAKGKAHRPYEFGSKVAVAVTNREGLVVASKAMEGNLPLPVNGCAQPCALSGGESASELP